MYSLVRLDGQFEEQKCLFCGKAKSCWYAIGGSITAKDYKILLDSGWRRHGASIRKIINHRTCCPAYTLWCDSQQFRISKKQKKVLRVMNNFLHGRGKFKGMAEVSTSGALCEDRPVDASAPSTETRLVEPPESEEARTQVGGKAGGKVEQESDTLATTVCYGKRAADPPVSEESGVSAAKISATTHDPSPKRRSRRKRKQARMKARAENADIQFATASQDYQARRQRRLDKNKPKDLEDYLRSEPREGEAAHFLDIRLYKCSPASAELEATLDEEFKLYSAYQVAVHKEAPGDVTRDRFNRHLVYTCIVSGNDADAEACGAPQVGSYHQQYWLDGKKLIGVGVLDLVPGGLSSAYFFYDTNYKFLRLGFYSALREMAFIRDLHRTFGSRVAAYSQPMQYTLGLYVHSCAKMEYKTRFSPSYLVCPETYTMVPVEKCQRMLDEKRRSRFADAGVKKAPPVKRHNAPLLLPFSHALIDRLAGCEFRIEGDAIVTNVADGEGELNCFDFDNVKTWLRLIHSIGTMRIDCSH